MKSSKVLWAERDELARKLDEAAKANDKDQALVLQGRLEAKEAEIADAIDAEDAMRAMNIVKPSVLTFGERVLGARDEFRGLEIGFKNDVSVVSVGGPTEIDTSLPAKLESVIANFASTIPASPSSAAAISYKRRGSQTGAPDTWGGISEGTSATKAKVLYSWSDVVANMETIAGYVPISKNSLSYYDDMLDIIEHDLVLDVNEEADERFVSGNNNSGIIGILNTTGIQVDETGYAGRYFDAIRHLKTLVMTNGRRVPTHVCVSPAIMEAMDVYKTDEGCYQQLGSSRLWGLEVVEDVNIDGILVYDANAARRRYRDQISVEVGYVNTQFIQNELTLLAERDWAFQVRYPSAFAYISQEDADADPEESGE